MAAAVSIAGSVASGSFTPTPPEWAARATRERQAVLDARRVLREWRLAEQAAPCVTAATCAWRTVFIDGVALDPVTVEHAVFQRWAARVAGGAEAVPPRVDDEVLWREAIATAVFLRELQAEIAPVASSPASVRKGRELAQIQARELAAMTSQERARMYELMPADVPVADPSAPEAEAGYARHLARLHVMDKLFGTGAGRGYDVAKAQQWLRARLAGRDVVLRNIQLPVGETLDSSLVLASATPAP